MINQVKNELVKEKELLLSKLMQGDIVDHSGDEVDEIQANIIAMTINKLGQRDKEKLQQIERALLKIKAGNFGSCEDCGEEIAEKRILVNPYCRLCISCAEGVEIAAKQKKN
jgi:DnaK suppressor protein